MATRRAPLSPQAPSSDPDSELYDANNESSPSPSAPSSSSSPLILYSPPTVWGLLRGAAINLILPFVNGLMLGFGELLAHEVAFRWGWSETKVFPGGRGAHTLGPGVEVRDRPDLAERSRREDEDLEAWTSME